jgi:glycosyltransferase involved in cell wall biosynthesis
MNQIEDIDRFNQGVNYCYIHNVCMNPADTRVIFSLFTTSYNSYDKILRAYNSIKVQTFLDWEWIILDDSPDDEKHWEYLKTAFANDKRVRIYKGSYGNNGSIGNVKNVAVSLCRGKYVLEMDHDDEIVPDLLENATMIFESDPEVGFVYADFTNIYENGDNFSYGDFYSLGYAGYYRSKYNGKWRNVSSTANVNNITLHHIVGIPNHPRIWKKDTLIKMGNYSEFLYISDDYELLLRTATMTKIVKLHKLGYIQYMNEGGNNFSLIRNSEINRLGPYFITPQQYEMLGIENKMKALDAWEDPKYKTNLSQIWRRGDDDEYVHKMCNKIVNLDYKRQYCIIGFDTLLRNKEVLYELYNDPTNDFIVLDNRKSSDELCEELDYFEFGRMKCYGFDSGDDITDKELERYFMLIYKSCEEYAIFRR